MLTKEAPSLAFSEVNPSNLKQTCGKKKKDTSESEVTLKCNSEDTLVPLETKHKPDIIGRVIVKKIAQRKKELIILNLA